MRLSLFFRLLFALFLSNCCTAQSIGNFTSVQPTPQMPMLVLPATHTFQLLSQTGLPIENGTLPSNPDFTGFVPINNSSTAGYLSINHETVPGSVTVFNANFNAVTKLWSIANGQKVNFNGTLTSNNCSGAVTPWGTVLSGEETSSMTDANNDGRIDNGWLVEINPVTRTLIRKIYAAGHCAHENAAIAPDRKTLYTGADDLLNGYLYKFVSDTAEVFNTGRLYVLRLSSNGNGRWLPLPNSTPTECNNTTALAALDSATNITGIEDVEIAPDGSVYLASKYSQQVFRFRDNGATISGYESFVGLHDYPIDYGTGTALEPWGWGNDNLCFDNEGNLWVLQDGTRNHIWVVRPNHTNAVPQVALFATTPIGSEPTGITFSPDNKFLFLSIQHPADSNRLVQIDAAGNPVIFNKASTIVIGRKEFLGVRTDTSTVLPIDGNWVKLIYGGGLAENPVLRFFITDNYAKAPIIIKIFDTSGKLLSVQDIGIQPIGKIDYTIPCPIKPCLLQVEIGNEIKTFKISFF